ncbi:aminotransferase class V-fold PLP-dependent enzyme [Lacticaseibacillus manihotivorans]|uniref:(2-aminoethyl)phosphonate--pyruvate aminotransferase n=2 Tax=Lacticaseibacillus manihotivorans TaxID=88233 RepID=A0A0R1PW16_9LACO|nr:aminotransferase class V-fold PLP-dependent enzyme [Lacticaseibacillus manihotivorans]KRL36705.1 (2-aminoethyl)phosphonate--pyruvate aminotransferase [Lacticaseibacillus manihotivorans DSM 13343 = JCM 12514]QFQ91711.1 aminotransferase class V-fold PLP-dependent enzyme [Lacticaseibacillus manihotivorans]
MNDVVLMTPDIASTQAGVKMAMQIDLAPQSSDFRALTRHLCQALLKIASVDPHDFACVLLPGDDATILEATLQTVIPNHDACVLVAVNGMAGTQIVAQLEYLNIPHVVVVTPQNQVLDQAAIIKQWHQHPAISHFIMCHQDPTAGVLNPLTPLIGQLHRAGVTTIVDARATFGGIPINCEALGIDYLITVFHHALHSVPGFGAVLANRRKIATTQGYARSLALDLYEQLAMMTLFDGAWRPGAPVQSVIAADRAVSTLLATGGVAKRYQHLRQLQQHLALGMAAFGFSPICSPMVQSPLMTAFAYPKQSFNDQAFAEALHKRGFEIASGIANRPSFRVATWGLVDESELDAFLTAVKQITQPARA